MDESLDNHLQAWRHYQSTVGPTNRRTADAGYKIAQHLLRLENYDEALYVPRSVLAYTQSFPPSASLPSSPRLASPFVYQKPRFNVTEEKLTLIPHIQRTMIDQSLQIWQQWPEAYTPQIARAFFLQSPVFLKMDLQARAITALVDAFKLRKSWLGERRKRQKRARMSMEDFDNMVTFWSR
ncbi:MAG: hypothetical protein Q9196_003007 [Gyalolechia fulgens]